MNARLLTAILTTVLLTAACGKFVPAVNESTTEGTAQKAALLGVADFSGMQVTGITVSKSGRTFASFPRWRDGVNVSVVEVKADGSWVPYPNSDWNTWTGAPAHNRFTCVQTVFADGNSLFVLDPSNPMFRGVVGQAALYEFDLTTNTLKNSWKFDDKAAPPRSYLNDLRVDTQRGLIYISDSGLGAILVLDTATGKTWRALEESPSTKSEPMTLVANGKPLLKPNGRPLRIHVEGLALYSGYLYYHSSTARRLYRISTEALAIPTMTATEIAGHVEDLGAVPPADGMAFDKMGNLFMGDLEKNAILVRRPNGEIRTFLRDPELKWVDSLAISPSDELVFTDSRIGTVTPGTAVTGVTFSVYKVVLPK